MKQASAKSRRERRARGKMQGTEKRPRLTIFRSNNHMYAQIIDDTKHVTLLGLSDKKAVTEKVSGKMNIAKLLGVALAKKAIEKKITSVVFDKGSYAYHGRIKAIAEGAREGGLQF